jgi:excisionase family DNA binding protein
MIDAALLTPAEAAPLLHHSAFTVWRWCTDGTLSALRIGRKWFIPRAEIERIQCDGTVPKATLKPTIKHHAR